jgi:hypothetical protein
VRVPAETGLASLFRRPTGNLPEHSGTELRRCSRNEKPGGQLNSQFCMVEFVSGVSA